VLLGSSFPGLDDTITSRIFLEPGNIRFAVTVCPKIQQVNTEIEVLWRYVIRFPVPGGGAL
jgi:hypothetical protein